MGIQIAPATAPNPACLESCEFAEFCLDRKIVPIGDVVLQPDTLFGCPGPRLRYGTLHERLLIDRSGNVTKVDQGEFLSGVEPDVGRIACRNPQLNAALDEATY